MSGLISVDQGRDCAKDIMGKRAAGSSRHEKTTAAFRHREKPDDDENQPGSY